MAELGTTASVCPHCLRRIPAELVAEGDRVDMVKNCPEHGLFRQPVWLGPPAFTDWTRPKVAHRGGPRQTSAARGCPFDCGLCPEHRQRSCTVLVEVTSRCNLLCPVCFANSGHAGPEPTMAELTRRLAAVYAATGGCNVQISGGEPTMRDDLPDIVRAARATGFTFVQLNSNGLRLAADPTLADRLAAAGLASVFLQFDTTGDGWVALRGRELADTKEQAIEALAASGIGVVLVATVVRGINDHLLWDICRYALARQPAVRGVHFQPLSLLGRYPRSMGSDHITLPELMRLLSVQSAGALRLGDFTPPGCEHALCSFSARYLHREDGGLSRLGDQNCSCEPGQALAGALRSIDWTAHQWSMPRSAATPAPPADDLDRFLQRAATHTFSLSAMAFQDCWTMNLERLQGCCIHVATADGRLVPFCAYNLTRSDGRALYREGV